MIWSYAYLDLPVNIIEVLGVARNVQSAEIAAKDGFFAEAIV